MRRLRLYSFWLFPAALAALFGLSEVPGMGVASSGSAPAKASEQAAVSKEAEQPPLPPRKTVDQVLDSGVIIMISLASQQMHVFRDGVLWRSSPVSTGRRGKETPTGVFAILQKKTFHRSNLYSNAPMPFMQRLTWDGIAIHAGHLPGYPASHGCIRVPKAFASELFAITRATSTAVIVADEALPEATEALALAQRTDALVPINPDLLKRESTTLARKAEPAGERLPAARIITASPSAASMNQTPVKNAAGRGQTIQLVAALSSQEAKAHWETLAARMPELRGMQVAIVPAVVKGTQYYRLRASAADAHNTCLALKRAGIDCFPVG